MFLRLDVDNPCYYHPIWIRVRHRIPIPIPGYYQPVRDTLQFLRTQFPRMHRVWFIRSHILPPSNLLQDEEIGLHVTNPKTFCAEHFTIAKHFNRELQAYSRHGDAPIKGGHVWKPEDEEAVKKDFPKMVDVSNKPHHTVTRLTDNPKKLFFDGIDHILFHPEHFKAARDELGEVLENVERC